MTYVTRHGHGATLLRSTSKDAKAYWDRIEKVAAIADKWPAWKKTDWVASERAGSLESAATRRRARLTIAGRS